MPGAAAPKLITREMLDLMQPGSVLVDVAIDQGGCFETSMPTTHQDPTFQINGVVHYCVANMPGAVARTSTLALTNVTQPFITVLANQGVRQALIDDPHLLAGLNVHNGLVTLQRSPTHRGMNTLIRDRRLHRDLQARHGKHSGNVNRARRKRRSGGLYRAGESRGNMRHARGQLPDCTVLNRANEGLSSAQWAVW